MTDKQSDSSDIVNCPIDTGHLSWAQRSLSWERHPAETRREWDSGEKITRLLLRTCVHGGDCRIGLVRGAASLLRLQLFRSLLTRPWWSRAILVGCVLLSTIDQTAGRVLSECYERLYWCYRQKYRYRYKKSHLNPHVCLKPCWLHGSRCNQSIVLLSDNFWSQTCIFVLQRIFPAGWTTRWNPSNVVKSYPISKKLVILDVKKNLLGLHLFLPFPINHIKCPGLISLSY